MKLIDQVEGTELSIPDPEQTHKSLKIEKLDEIATDQGKGRLYTIGLLTDERKPIYAVMLEYIVVDHRGIEAEQGPVFVYPTKYRDDVNGIAEDSVAIKNGKIGTVNTRLQTTHVNYTDQWLVNLKTEGYL